MDGGEEKLVALVNAWAAYREAHTDADLTGFCLHYLTERAQDHLIPVAHHHPAVSEGWAGVSLTNSSVPDSDMAATVSLINERWVESLTGKVNRSMIAVRAEARLGALVGRLSKYAYFYSKKALQPFDFKNIDDPVYLIVLVQMGTPKKSELVYEMMSEFASGIDIINRLVKMELIDEFPDETDRRSKRLQITEKGLTMIRACFPVMDRVADIAYSSLTDGERTLLISILEKLDRYHATHYRESRTTEFDVAYERMVTGQG